MNIIDFFRYSFSALKDRKLRSALTILMVIVGTAMLTSMNGMSAGMDNFIDEQFSLLGPNLLIVSPAPLVEGGSSNPATLTDRTVNSLRNIDEEVIDVFPSITRSIKIELGGKTLTTSCMGTDPRGDPYVVPTASIREGAQISTYDSVGITLGYDIYHPPGEENPLARVGQIVTVKYQYAETVDDTQELVTKERNFIVRGIWEKTGGGSMLNLDNAVYISVPAANSFFEASGEYDMIIVVTTSPETVLKVENSIKEVYGNNLGVTSPRTIIETIQEFIAGFSVFTTAIAMVSLIVAAVGVMTTLYTSTVERTREIGLLKALGFKNQSILLVFIIEAAIVGMIGAAIGLALGSILSTALMATGMGFGLEGINPVFLLEDLAFVWSLAVGISMTAGFYPAWRASRVNPIESLRK